MLESAYENKSRNKQVNFEKKLSMLISTLKDVCFFDANTNDGNNHLNYVITSLLHENYHLFLKSDRQKMVKTMLFKISIHKVVNFHP